MPIADLPSGNRTALNQIIFVLSLAFLTGCFTLLVIFQLASLPLEPKSKPVVPSFRMKNVQKVVRDHRLYNYVVVM